jgi:hypothetical protein
MPFHLVGESVVLFLLLMSGVHANRWSTYSK